MNSRSFLINNYNTFNPINTMQQLYQDNPRVKSTYTHRINRSFTDSLESYQNGAAKEVKILRLNQRLPRVALILHFLTVLSLQDIKKYRTKIHRYLQRHGLEAVMSIEPTRDRFGCPSNTVHFHIITDDPRSEHELKDLLIKACSLQGLVEHIDFCVDYRVLYDPDGYLDYFTKRYCKDVILFQIGLCLQKFYQIGKWFRKKKSKLWKDFIRKIYGTG